MKIKSPGARQNAAASPPVRTDYKSGSNPNRRNTGMTETLFSIRAVRQKAQAPPVSADETKQAATAH
jgi:hypothetical protein